MSRATTSRPLRARIFVVALCTSVLALPACRVERKSQQPVQAAKNAVDNFQNPAFDSKTQVVDVWDSKVIPALQKRAADFLQLRTAIRAGLDAAGAKYGYRERGEGAPWNFSTTIKGTVVDVDTESSAGKMGVDVDGDGKADVEVQIGPVISGTSVRDTLDFVSFNSYSNQVEFAQLANAFNAQAYDRALKALPRDSLKGRHVELLGTFSLDDASDEPIVTPVMMSLDGKPRR
jgi:predicted lipoprotein